MSDRHQLKKAVRKIPSPVLMIGHFVVGVAFHLTCGIYSGIKEAADNWLAEFRMIQELDKKSPTISGMRSRIRQNHESE